MIPAGFKTITPTAAPRADHIAVKMGVDAKQIITFSFNLLTADLLGLVSQARTPDAGPEPVKKLAVGIDGNNVGLFPVPMNEAGFDIKVTKGQTPRAQVQIPLPALFNKVVEPFRQEGVPSDAYRFEHGGVIVDAGLMLGLEPKQAEEQQQVQQETAVEPEAQQEQPETAGDHEQLQEAPETAGAYEPEQPITEEQPEDDDAHAVF